MFVDDLVIAGRVGGPPVLLRYDKNDQASETREHEDRAASSGLPCVEGLVHTPLTEFSSNQSGLLAAVLDCMLICIS